MVGACLLANRLHELSRGRFSRLASGYLGGQLLTVAATPVLARLYSPESWREFLVFTSLSGIITSLVGVRTVNAVHSATDDESVVRTLFVSFLVVVCGSVMLAVAAGAAALVVSPETSRRWLSITMLSLAAAAGAFFVQALVALRTRHGSFSTASTDQWLQSGVLVASQLVLGVLAIPSGLAIGSILASLVAMVLLIARYGRATVAAIAAPSAITSEWMRLRSYVTSGFASAVLNGASLQLPGLLIGTQFATTLAAPFSLAQRVMTAPLRSIGNAWSQLATAQLGAAFRDGRGLDREFSALAWRSSLLAVSILVPVAFVCSLFWRQIFGDGWERLPLIVWLLVPLSLAQFVGSSLSLTPSVVGRPAADVVVAAVRVGVAVLSLVVVPMFVAWELAGVLCYVLAGAAGYLLNLRVYSRLVREARA